MKLFELPVALTIAFVCAIGQGQDYKGRSLAEWKARTKPEFSLAERRDAILALRAMAWDRTVPARSDADVQWLADEVMPAFIELLHDREPVLREQAACAISNLGRKASGAAIPVLVELLGDENERVRRMAVGALAFRGPQAEQAIPALVKAVKEDTSRDIRSAAAFALRTTGPEGAKAMIAMLDDPNAEIRRAVVENIRGGIVNGESQNTPDEALPKLLALLADDSADVRKGAANAITHIPSLSRETLFGLLHHKDVKVRHITASGLLYRERNEPTRFRKELLQLAAEDMAFARQHAGLLSRLGLDAIPIMVKLLDDGDPWVRAEAADGLAMFGAAAAPAVPVLKRRLGDMTDLPHGDLDDRVCWHAAYALNRILGDRDYTQGLPPKRPDGK